MTAPGWRAGWRTPTRSSNGGNCVEVDFTAAGVQIRDSKARGAGPIIEFTPAQWAVFVREAAHRLPSANGAVTVTHHRDGTRVRSSEAILDFTPGEWTASSQAPGTASSTTTRRRPPSSAETTL
ncbi:MAG: DUF397 domain-containing protein [Pseudonocardiaceae bacterium]